MYFFAAFWLNIARYVCLLEIAVIFFLSSSSSSSNKALIYVIVFSILCSCCYRYFVVGFTHAFMFGGHFYRAIMWLSPNSPATLVLHCVCRPVAKCGAAIIPLASCIAYVWGFVAKWISSSLEHSTTYPQLDVCCCAWKALQQKTINTEKLSTHKNV